MKMRCWMKHGGAVAGGLAVLASALTGAAFGQASRAPSEGVIVQKNLFSPTRQPWVPPPAPVQPVAPPKPEPPPQFVVYGVLIFGDERQALVKEPKLTGGKVEQVSLGARVGPYRLARIDADRVVLEKEGSSVTVVVDDPARPKGQVIALPAPPPPPAVQIPAPQPARSSPETGPSPIQKLTEIFSRLPQGRGLPLPGQAGQ